MAAQQIGRLEAHDDRRELREPRVEPQRAAAAGAQDDVPNYYFYDLNGKINHQINRNHQISAL